MKRCTSPFDVTTSEVWGTDWASVRRMSSDPCDCAVTVSSQNGAKCLGCPPVPQPPLLLCCLYPDLRSCRVRGCTCVCVRAGPRGRVFVCVPGPWLYV